MEPVYQQKRQAECCYEYCIICQETRNEPLRHGTAHGLKTLQYWASERRKYHDNRNLETIDRLEKLCENDLERILWQPKCYATFTDKGKVNRPEKSSKNNETGILRRSAVSNFDWKFCLFCQTTKVKDKTRYVATFNLSNSYRSPPPCIE